MQPQSQQLHAPAGAVHRIPCERLRAAALMLLAACAWAASVRAEDAGGGFECVVVPHSVLDLSSGVSGRLNSVAVERAERITAGQVLAALESDVERANLTLARTRASMTSEVSLREASFEYDRRRQDRIDNLHLKRVASEQELDDANRSTVLAGWQIAVAKDNLRLARLEAERAEATLALREVRSPFDGVVVERFKSPGEYVDEEPILRVARLDPLRVEVIVPIARHAEFQVGLMADVYPEIDPHQPWRATVTAVDAVADPASGTFRARLELPNPERRLLAGIRCTAALHDQPATAPAAAEALPAPRTPASASVDTATRGAPG